MIRLCPKCKIKTERYKSGDCKPCAKVSVITWRSNNIEKVKTDNAKWSSADHSANPEKYKAKNDIWYKSNSELWRIYNHNRRALERANGGKLSKGLSERLFKLQKGKCPCCNKPLGTNFHLDHITPIYLGGANEDWNIQLLRQQCNSQKRAKDPIKFMQSRGFLL